MHSTFIIAIEAVKTASLADRVELLLNGIEFVCSVRQLRLSLALVVLYLSDTLL